MPLDPAKGLRRLRAATRLAASMAVLPRPGAQVAVAVCVDCDDHDTTVGTLSGVAVLQRIHKRLGVTGAVTWFVNQRYHWTDRYPDLLRQLLQSGDRVEMHGHAERFIGPNDAAGLRRFLSDQLDSLQTFCQGVQPGYRVECFRSGSLDRSHDLYRALEELGIRYDSTLAPGYRRKLYDRLVDDTDLPSSRNCFYLDPQDYKRAQPHARQIVEVPVMLAGSRSLHALLANPDRPLVLATLIHPYNVVDRQGRPNRYECAIYELTLRAYLRLSDGNALSLREAGERWRAAHPDGIGD